MMSEQLAMSSRRGLRPLVWLAGLLVVWVWLEQVLVHHDRRAIESTGIAFRSEDVCVKHTVNIALLGCGGEAESLE